MGKQSLITYILEEYIDGHSLAWIADVRTLTGQHRIEITEPFLRTIMKRVLVILTILHRSGISHCDLKPDNIMIDPRGQVWLVDFGWAALNAGALHECRGSQ